MRIVRQVLPGLLIALVSVAITLGVMTLSFAEGIVTAPTRIQPPTQTRSPTTTPTWQTLTLPSASETPVPPTLTFTLPPSSTNCPPPLGWISYTVQPGDTLAVLAVRYLVSTESLSQANCLLTTDLLPGSQIYVPLVSTRTPVTCGPPSGWITYVVQVGDTLYRLSLAYGVTVQELQSANCLGASTLIRTGRVLNVPPWATHTPVTMANPTLTPTVTLSSSPTDEYIPTFTPTETPTPSPTEVIIPTETFTPQPTETFTETPTESLTP